MKKKRCMMYNLNSGMRTESNGLMLRLSVDITPCLFMLCAAKVLHYGKIAVQRFLAIFGQAHYNPLIMRKHYLILLFAASLAILSCKKESGQSPEPGNGEEYKLNVHLWNHFDDDLVSVLIDGDEIFKGKVTTNYTLSLAAYTSSLRSSGSHTVAVIVNHLLVDIKTISLNSELWVGVDFDAGKFNFTVSPMPFFYD
jgi:hypothetical protein